MTRVELDPLEPEETVGKLWHSFASRLDAPILHHGLVRPRLVGLGALHRRVGHQGSIHGEEYHVCARRATKTPKRHVGEVHIS